MKHSLTLGVLIALVLAAMMLQAAPAAPAPAIGVVDSDMVQRNYKASREAMTYLGDFQKTRRAIFEELRKGQYLTLAEYQEYQTLVGSAVKIDPKRIAELQAASQKTQTEYDALQEKLKGALTPEEQATLTRLENAENVSPDDVKAYQALQDKAKAALNEADRTRLTALDDAMKQVVEELNTYGEKLGGEIQTERQRISDLLQNKVNDAIASVGKKQKLLIVLNRNVETQDGATQMVLWGGTDITEAVTKELNDAFTPEVFKKK